MKFKFESIQQLGRALMLPIALLPVAGLLLRFGQPDLLNIKFIADAGNAIFTNLPILFALGVAVGIAKENNGTAALAAAVGYLIMTTILTTIDKDINTGVLGGILIGIVAAMLYNKYKDIRLPDYLAFFGGKRFVPIITGLTAVILGIILGYIWPPIQHAINDCGLWLIKSGPIGLFIYGVLNRLLLVTGLHHVINNLVWFVFGNYTNITGTVVHGDIAMFMSGDKNAGFFMAGFFPIMMFGLPAACLAMYRNAHSQNKKAVAGLLLSLVLTSFLTGVTEPIEYSFVFLAPILYVIHALLTGISMATMYFFNVHLGFTFSAGLVDYVLFFKEDTHPLYLLPIGAVFFFIYYTLFSFAIRKFNLPTIGRGDEGNTASNETVNANSDAFLFVESLGGSANIVNVDACTTRLRLVVKDSSNINREILNKLGARGVLAPSKESLQVILGPIADMVASDIREVLKTTPNIRGLGSVNLHEDNHEAIPEKVNGDELSIELVNQIANGILVALGGVLNITSINLVALSRIQFTIKDSKLIKKNKLPMEVRWVDTGSSQVKQIYIGSTCNQIYQAITI